jgi:hypothetical protein
VKIGNPEIQRRPYDRPQLAKRGKLSLVSAVTPITLLKAGS